MEVKRAKVIMLPTNNGVILKGIKNKGLSAPIILSNESNEEWDKFGTPQHLYFTTDEDIKSGDWKLINTDTDKLSTVVQHEKGINYYKQSKIIATTDKSLTFIPKEIPSGIAFELPQPSKSFIEKYCKLGGIDKVELECRMLNIDEIRIRGGGFLHTDNSTLELTPNNEVIVHLIKEKMYTREEVESLILRSHIARGKMINLLDEIPEWIDNNL